MFGGLDEGLDGLGWGFGVNHSCIGWSRLGPGPKRGFVGSRVKAGEVIEVSSIKRSC